MAERDATIAMYVKQKKNFPQRRAFYELAYKESHVIFILCSLQRTSSANFCVFCQNKDLKVRKIGMKDGVLYNFVFGLTV